MRTSLRVKLVKTMVLTLVIVATATLAVVVAMSVVASRRTLKRIETHLKASIEEKGQGLVTSQALALRDLVADNAFGDVARLVQRTVEKDADLMYGLFVDENNKAWAFVSNPKLTGFPKDWHAVGLERPAEHSRLVAVTHKTIGGETTFEFAMPVADDKGERLGILAYGLSDAPLRLAVAEARGESRNTLILTVVMLVVLAGTTIVLGGALSRRSATRITQPVGDLTQAVQKLAGGSRDIRVTIASGDELEVLGGAFNNMAGELADSYGRLEAMNRTLEQRVEERTAELALRNRDMRLVLDNVNQGFLTVSINGTLANERSGIVDKWFGGYEANTTFFDYISRIDEAYGVSFRMGLEAIAEDFLPLELCVDQMPARLRTEGKEFRCTYYPLMKGEKCSGLLIVINDVTAELLHARQEGERKEVLATFEGLAKDRAGFIAFLDEAGDMVQQLPSSNLETQKRLLHTIKGNAALSGLSIVAGIAHELEDLQAERDAALTSQDLTPLSNRWEAIGTAVKTFLGDKGRDVIELDSKEIDQVIQMIDAGSPSSRVLDRLASWWLESAEVPMRRLARYATMLTRRLGKGELQVEIEANNIRLAPKAWAGFWSDLVHVIRNAIDHGIEVPDERSKVGKPGSSRLRLVVRLEQGNRLIVEVADDGRGVDWEAVRKVAIRKGLPHETQQDLVDAIFSSGVSTREEVTSLSGRGVGLAAVKQQVHDLGGAIAVETTPGRGTCFRFTFAVPHVGPRFGIDVEPSPPMPQAA